MKHRDHYEILGLPSPQSGVQSSPQAIKTAYRKALLRHHPDKAPPATVTPPGGQATAEIDEIMTAHKVLSCRATRTEYDRTLVCQVIPTAVSTAGHDHAPAAYESIDLEEMVYDSRRFEWSRSCRCGDVKGFLLTEADLDEAAERGVLLVGCTGCSLCLSVGFKVDVRGDDGPDTADEGPRGP